MLTPQEVSQHAFAKASFGGYNMAMVDEFLDALTEDYTTLYKENQVLKSKMKILVDKVEEYRATDESMRKAFLVAQRSAEEIVAKAESEREGLIQQAEAEARSRVAGMRTELETEGRRLAAAQTATGEFIERVRELCRRQLESLDALPELIPPAAAPSAEPAEPTIYDIAAAMQTPTEEPGRENTLDLDKELEDLLSHADEETEEDEEDEPFVETTRRFDNLQFGRDYEIK